MSLQRNVVYQTLEKAVHTLGGMLGMVLVAQYLGSSALADYGFAISLAAFFLPALDLGMNNRLIKAVAARESIPRTLERVVAYKLVSAPLVIGVMMFAGLVWGSGPGVPVLVMLVGISTVSMSLGDGASSVFKGLQQSHVSCWLITGLNIVLLVGLTVTMMMDWGLVAVGWCYALSRVGYAVAAFMTLIQSVPDASFSVKIEFDRKMIVDGFFHLPGIYYLGNLLSLSYLATYVMSPDEAGLYYVGYRAAAATYVLVSAGFEAVLVSSVAGVRRPSGLGGCFLTLGLIALLLLYVAAPLVSVVFGEAFSGSIRPIRLLALCVPTFALCGLGHTLLMAARYERFGTYVLIALLAGGFGLALSGEFLFGPEVTALVPATSSFIAMNVLWAGLTRFVPRDAR